MVSSRKKIPAQGIMKLKQQLLTSILALNDYWVSVNDSNSPHFVNMVASLEGDTEESGAVITGDFQGASHRIFSNCI
jgi:hypothetical protein